MRRTGVTATRQKWGELIADFKECKVGKEQSPIDIQTKATEKAKLRAIGFNYKATLSGRRGGRTSADGPLSSL